MMVMNKDYGEIRNQLEYVGQYLDSCFNSVELFINVDLWNALKIFSDTKCVDDVFRNFDSLQIQLYDEARCHDYNKLKGNFAENASFHQNFLTCSYQEVSQLAKEMKGNYSLADIKHYFTLERNKDQDCSYLLEEFLIEEDRTLFDIYLDICKQERIYYNKANRNACVVYNHLQNIPNIFLPFKTFNIEACISLAHELGHVRDFMGISDFSSKDINDYALCSSYQEVISFDYENKFLQFLMEDHDYVKEVQRAIFHNVRSLEESIKQDRNTIAKGNCNIFTLFCDIQYSYGPIVAASLDTLIEKRCFQQFQYDYFDSKKLEENGLSPQVLSHNYVKKMRDIMRK